MAHETPVALLNQLCMKNDLTPEFNLLAREGRVHAPVFTYQVSLLGISEEGNGQSKKKAKQIVARQMLKRLLTCDQFPLEPEEKELIDRCLARSDEEDLAEGVLIQATGQQEAIQCAGGSGSLIESSGSKPMSAGLIASEIGDEMNPVGKLQELCGKKSWNLPHYEDVAQTGQPHEPMFQVVCIIANMHLQETGIGKTKKLAKRAAAQKMLNKLRMENLDQVDELPDRLPKSTRQNAASFDFSEMLKRKQSQDSSNEAIVSHHFTRFYADLAADSEKTTALEAILGSDPRRVIIKYMDGDTVIPEVMKLTVCIEILLDVTLNIATYPEKRNGIYFQCLAELIANAPKYEAVSVSTSVGMDAELEQAKLKAMSRCVVMLLMMIY